jgi:hypothetical protein
LEREPDRGADEPGQDAEALGEVAKVTDENLAGTVLYDNSGLPGAIGVSGCSGPNQVSGDAPVIT